MRKGKFVVIIGPSAGVGKTSLVKRLLEQISCSVRVITMTTRQPRPGEVEGRDFFFVTRTQFEKMRDAGEMMEWSEHLNNYYGTPKKNLEKILNDHPVVFGVIDINGAEQIMEQYPDVLTIFIKPGNVRDLRERLLRRDGITDEDREARLKRIPLELEAAHKFHHTVVNIDGKFENTFEEVLRIVRSHII